MEGCDLRYISERFGEGAGEELTRNVEKDLKLGNIEISNSSLVLTKPGKFLADGIAAGLFFERLEGETIREDKV
jgi:hypothetical protein